MNKTKLENWEERFDEKLLLLAMDIVEKAHKEEVLNINSSELKKIVKNLLASSQKDKEEAYQSGVKAERKRTEANIGFLRQWLNEKPEKMLVTNEDIEEWLFDFEPLKGK